MKFFLLKLMIETSSNTFYTIKVRGLFEMCIKPQQGFRGLLYSAKSFINKSSAKFLFVLGFFPNREFFTYMNI